MATADVNIIIRAVDMATAQIQKVTAQTSKLRMLGSTFQQVGMAAAGMGAAAAIPIAGAVKSFADMEDQLRNVNAVLGGNEKSMKKLSEVAVRVGKESSFSLSQVGTAMYAMASAGYQLEDLQKMTKPVTLLAEAIHADLGQSTELVTDTISTFGLKAADASKVVDVFATAVKKSPETMERLKSGLRYAGPVFNAFEKDLDDAVSALMVFETAGIHGEKAGTGLRQVMTALASPTDALMSKLSALGLTAEDINPSFNSLDEIIDKLSESGFTGADAMKYFSARAGSGMAVLLSKGGQALRNFESQLQDVDGTAQTMQKEQLSGLAGKFRMLASSIETMLAAFGKTKGNAIGKFLDKLKGLVDWFTELNPKVQNSIMTFGMWTAGLLLGGGALALLLGSIMKMVATFKEFGAAIKGLATLTPKLQGVFSGLSKMIITFGKSIVAGLKGAVAFLIANPIVALIAGIAAGVILLIMHWDKIAPAIKKAVEAVGKFLKKMLDVIVGFFKAVWGGITKGMKATWDFIVKVAKAAWDGIKAVWNGVVEFFKAVWDGIKKGFVALWNVFKKIMEPVVGFFKEVWNGVAEFFVSLWDGIKEFFSNLWKRLAHIATSVWDGAKKAWETVVGFFKKIWNGVAGFFKGIWEGIVNGVKAAGEKTKGIWDKVGGFFKGVWEKIGEAGKVVMDAVKKYVGTMAQNYKKLFVGIVKVIKAAWEGLVKFFRIIWDALKKGFEATVGFIGKVWAGLKNVIVKVWDGILNFISKIVEGIGKVFENTFGFISNIIGTVANWFVKAWDKAVSTVQTILNFVIGIFKNIWSGIVRIIGPVIDWLISAWEKFAGFWKSLWQGLKKVALGVFDGIIWFINKFIGAINWTLGVLKKLGITKKDLRIPEIRKVSTVDVDMTINIDRELNTEQALKKINQEAANALAMESGLSV